MVFVPKQSCKSLFTVMAKDNINLNAASASATGHFHGTSMFIFNFRTENFDGEPLSYNFPRDVSSSSYKVEALPKKVTLQYGIYMVQYNFCSIWCWYLKKVLQH